MLRYRCDGSQLGSCVGLKSLRLRQRIAPQPDCERARPPTDPCFHRSSQNTGFEQRAVAAGDLQHFVTHCDFCIVAGCDLHQAAGNVDRVTRSRDVLIAFAAESRGYDWPQMRSNLEAEPGCGRCRQGDEPIVGAAGEPCTTASSIEGVICRWFRQTEHDHGSVTHETRDDAAAACHLFVHQRMKIFNSSRVALGPNVSLSPVKPDRSMNMMAASRGQVPRGSRHASPATPPCPALALVEAVRSAWRNTRARCLPSQSCAAPNRIAGGTAAAIGSAALSQIWCEKAITLTTNQTRTTPTIAARPMALRRHANRPTRTIGNATAKPASQGERTDLAPFRRRSPDGQSPST